MSNEYKGFELGPIRPPSEAQSLMLRVTRNCPWNKCTFCSLYKDEKFSIRPKEHIFKDIDLIKKSLDIINEASILDAISGKTKLKNYLHSLTQDEQWAYYSAQTWLDNSMESIFLQDANTMVIKPYEMIEILNYIKKVFPHEKRITSYARSQTITKISPQDLSAIKNAGLNRIHIGMETANDTILKLVKKGATKDIHIRGGQKVKQAGIELSEYYMPGLGGVEYSSGNAKDSADALNQINPEFIRIRTLAVKDNLELYDDYNSGVFTRTTDAQVAQELLMFIENLNNIDSVIKSDHILNLLPDVEGNLKTDKKKILNVLNDFLSLNKEEQMIYQVGRRLCYMKSTDDLNHFQRRKAVEDIILQENINSKNIDVFVEDRLNQFI
jgi:radical SAM superfamily enzyme YgiQ (UPF0313 family)